MIDLSVNNVTKAYQLNKNILDGLSFEVNSGERIGIMGRNGAGKTTLFNIITGALECDEGDVVIAPGKRAGLISQIPHYPAGFTVEDVLREAFSRQRDVRRKMDELERLMDAGSATDRDIKRYGELSALFEHLEGYDTEVQLNKVCSGLDIPAAMRERVFSSLSGGEMTRINLARLLLEKTDILLLDEPTNHLDITGVEWLEDYLTTFRGTVLTVSHDRYFLDRVVTRIVEIEAGKATTHTGNYTEFVRWKTQLELEQQKRYEKEQAKIKQLQFTAERMHGWGLQNEKLMKRSQAIEKRIARMQTTEAPKKQRELKASFSSVEFRGDEALLMADVSKSFGERTLFSDVQLLVKGGERIGIIGDNGAGKSTLIRMIMGEERPDRGIIKLGPAIKAAYLPQQVFFPDESRTLVDTVIRALDCTAQTARNRLGSFDFRAEDAFKCVNELSGGEKSRLALCILMDADVNLLILDEPTNHLDVPSRNWIENAVEDYEGALLFVSHDRYFISRFAERIWSIEDGHILDVDGDYEEYKRLRKKREAEAPKSAPKPEQKKQPKPKNNKNLKKELRTKLLAVERSIAGAEEAIAQCDRDAEEYATDYAKLTEIYTLRQQKEQELEELMARWEELGSLLEQEE